jgi:hypothetical protein
MFKVYMTMAAFAFGVEHGRALSSPPSLRCLADDDQPGVGLPEITSDGVDCV